MFDPFDIIEKLVTQAKQDFKKFGKELVDEVQRLIDSGRIFPLNAKKIRLLREIFDNYRLKIQIRLTGFPKDKKTLKEFKRIGLISNDVSYIELSHKIGKIIQELRRIGKEEKGPTLEELIKRSQEIPMTPVEKRAIKYVQQNAANRVKPIVDHVSASIEGAILDHEKRIIRKEVASGIKERIGPMKLKQQIMHGALNEDLNTGRNYERVARTELIEALSQGIFGKIAHDFKGEDPVVYKITSPYSCKHCKRIWGPPENPRLYKLSEIANNPSNEHIKPDNWIAQIGVIHPNCTEGGLIVKVKPDADNMKGDKK